MALAELIEKYGAEAIEKALAGGEKGAAEEAFNVPKFKVGETPVAPQDFAAAHAAQDIPPVKLTAEPPSFMNAPPQKQPNMTPIKEELPAFGSHLDTLPPPQKEPSTWEEIVNAAKGNKGNIIAGTAATIGGAAMMPSTQNKTSKTDDYDKKPTQQWGKSEDDDGGEEETPATEQPSTTKAPPSQQNSSKETPTAQPSKTQTLADIMQAQGADQGNYQDALHKRDLSTLVNQLGQASELIGTGLSRTAPVAQDLFKQNIALAQQGPKDYVEGKQAELLDPNSAVSKNYREFLSRYGVNVGPGVTAQQIKDTLLPSAQKEQDIKEKLEATKAIRGQTQQLHEQARQDKLDKNTTARIDRVGKVLDAELASSRSAFGRSANTHQAAEKIEAMVKDLDPNSLTTQQIAELTRNLDGMLSNGQPTVSGMNKLLPSSAMGDASKMAAYISNIPVGAQQAAFVQNMLQTVRREKTLAAEQMQQTQGKILGPYNDLKDQPVFQEMLRMKGLPSNIFEPTKGGKTQTPDTGNSDKVKVMIDGQQGLLPRKNLEAAKKLHPNLQVLE